MHIYENKRIMRNQRSNLSKRRIIYSRRIREEEADLEVHSGHEALRKSEGGGVIVPDDKELFDMSEIKCLLINHRRIRDNLKEVVSCHPKWHHY